MTSDNQIAANRINAKRSTGPRTARGKSRASRNALRHGWRVAKRHSTASAEVERMAKAICGDNATPALYEQAVTIADCDIRLRALRAAQIAALQRRPFVSPQPAFINETPGFPTIEEWRFGFQALARGQPRPATRLFTRAARALRAADAKRTKVNVEANSNAQSKNTAEANANVETKSPSHRGGEQLPFLLMICMDPADVPTSEDQPAPQHNDVDAVRRALPELVKLDRYERRIMARRKRAIRMFDAISVVTSFVDRETKRAE